MTKRILYPIVFALLLLLGGWGSKASGQSSEATYAVRYTLPKGVSDLRCVTYLPSEGKVVVTSGRKLPVGAQLTFTATVEAGYEIDHWTVNGKLAQHEPEAYGGAKMMEMEMPGEDINVVIVMKEPKTATDECRVRLTPSTPDGGMLSAYYLERNPFTGDEEEIHIDDGDRVPKFTTLKVTAVPNSGYTIGQWYQDGVAIEGSKGMKSVSVVVRGNTEIKVDFESSGQSFEGVVFTFQEDAPKGTITAYYEDDNFNHKAFHSGDKVPMGKMAYFTATPKAGYEFDYWTLNGEKGSRYLMVVDEHTCKLTAKEDDTIGAVFKQTTPAGHKITLTAGEGGTIQCLLSTGSEVQSGSTVDDGVALRFNARPMSGYKTDQWTINGEPFAKGKGRNTITQKADKDLNVEVSFLKDIELYTVEYVAEEGGTIKSATYYDRTSYNYVAFQSGKELPKDSEINIEVEPKAGYVVDLWYLNDQPIDASKGKTSQTITIRENSKIRITFTTKPKQTVTYTASTGGTIQGTLLGTAFDSGSKLDEGSYIIFTATPDEGYEVDQWRIDGEIITRYAGKKEIQERLGNKPLKVEVSFKKLPVTFPVVFTAGEGGTIVATVAEGSAQKSISSGDAIVQYSRVTFTAKPKSGYLVDQWTVNDQPQQFFAGKPELTRSVREALKVHVTFKEDKPAKLCTINYTKENEWGTLVAYYDTQSSGRINVKPGDKVEEGYMITFLATPKEGYTIDHWTYNGTKTPTVKPEMLTVTAKEDMTVAVVCNKAKLCTVTFDAVNEGGTMTASYLKDEGFNGYKDVYITSGEQVPAGTEVTFVVTLTEGYTLEYWLVNKTKKECDRYNPLRLRELVINEDTEVKAVYKAPQKPQYSVTYTAGEGGRIVGLSGDAKSKVDSGSKVDKGTMVRLIAIADTDKGYMIDQWTINGEVKPEYTGKVFIIIPINTDTKISVSFKKQNKYKVFFTSDNEWGKLTAKYSQRGFIDVESGQELKEGTIVYFSASVKDGYEIDSWTCNGNPIKDSTPKGAKITLKTDSRIEVQYHKLIVKHAVTFTAGEGGAIAATVGTEAKAIQSKDQVEQGAVITFTATAQEGYELDQWKVNGKPAVAGADTKIEGNKLIVTLGNQDLTVEVTFKKVIVTYEVTYSAGEGGDIIGANYNGRTIIPSGSKVNENDYMRFTAKPNTAQDYKVDQWIVNGQVQSQLTGRPFINWQIKTKTNVKVTFRKEQMYEVDYKPDNEWGTIEAYYYDGGRKVTVEPKAKVKEGTFVEFQATVKDGYVLDGWTNNGQEIPVADIETLKASLTLRADAVIDVKYHKLVVKHVVTFTAGEGGTIAATVGADAKAIQSKDQVELGAVITFTATAKEGYELDQWMVNGKPAVAGADTKIEGNKLIVTLGNLDLTVEVTFKKLIVKHAVTFTAGEGGTIAATAGAEAKAIESKDQVEQGTVITFTATPQEGYELDQWMVNGKPAVAGADTKIEGNKLIITLGNQDLTVKVTFKKLIVKHVVTFTAGEGGTIAATVGADAKAIQSKDQVEQGAIITFTATAKEGYELDQWMVNGKPAIAGADTKIEGNKLIVTLGGRDLTVEVTFRKVNAITQISEAELAVYPNPFAERIVITIPAELIGQTAYLTSMQGAVVLQMTLEQTENVIYTDALSHGTYLLRVGSQSQLLIKE